MTQTPDITTQSWIMIVVLGLTWGSTFLVIELALPGIAPVWLAAARITIATILMAAVQFWRKAPFFLDKSARPWGMIIFIALLSSALPFNLLSWGQQYVTSGFAGVSMAAVALMVLPLAHFMVPGETLTWRKTTGFIIGFVGVCVLIGGQAFDTSGSPQETLGRAACLGAAGCYAISSILMRRLPPVDPINLSGVLLGIGALAVLPIAFITSGTPGKISTDTIMWLLLLGLIPTAGANVLRVILIRTAGPVFMSITNYIVPVCSVIMGWLILSEPLPGTLLIALIMILCGVGLSQYGPLTRLFRGQS